MTKKSFWKRGQRARLARLMGMSEQNLSEILHRRRGVSPQKAAMLEKCSEIVLTRKFKISHVVWLFNKETKHPAFFQKPRKLKKISG